MVYLFLRGKYHTLSRNNKAPCNSIFMILCNKVVHKILEVRFFIFRVACIYCPVSALNVENKNDMSEHF